jgi:release factor glutamine methyltransferase
MRQTGQIIRIAVKKLQAIQITSASIDAELLLSFVLKKPREYILAHPEIILNKKQIDKYDNLIKQRAKHVPLAYLVKEKEFYGRPFYVDERVLVPRPETELIISECKMQNAMPTGKQAKLRNNTVIIDIGTGSGCIIITLVKGIPNQKSKIKNLKFFATDISRDALAVARKNARIHKVDKKIKFLRGNLLEPVLQNKKLIIDNCELIIVANLPYLDSNLKNLLQSSDSKALKYEPQVALKGGKDGLKYYRELAAQIKKLRIQYPNTPLSLFSEIGDTQRTEMKKIFSFAKDQTIKKDLAGRDRIFIAKL